MNIIHTHVEIEGRMNLKPSWDTVKIDLFVKRVEVQQSEFYCFFIATHFSTFKNFIRHKFLYFFRKSSSRNNAFINFEILL